MPRTQTSDPAVWFWQSPVLFWAFNNVTSNQVLMTANRPGSMVVITSMDLFNSGGASGDSAAIAVRSPAVPIFGGQIGAGVSDTFSWRGMCPINNGETFSMFVVSGEWSTIGAGFYIPAVIPS